MVAARIAVESSKIVRYLSGSQPTTHTILEQSTGKPGTFSARRRLFS